MTYNKYVSQHKEYSNTVKAYNIIFNVLLQIQLFWKEKLEHFARHITYLNQTRSEWC